MTEVEEVKARLDILDVIGQYVQLQRAGRSFKALCPFHSERTPSFIVSPERQSWHCFGACGTGGDVIAFVMRKEGLEFPEALRMLAQRAGVPLRERQRSPDEDRQRERLRAAQEAAAQWYRQMLLRSEAAQGARKYLERRGVDVAAAEAFQLGHSPPAWEATRQHLHERGFSDAELLAAGLLVEGESGLHDRFRGRLMFPIRDLRGWVIGFGARALDDTPPKYLNTSQTAVFDKGSTLYGLDRAAEAIRKGGRAVIVEGYMDVIAAHQHGFADVVATMGTSLTERQVRLLKRFTRNIVVALDIDQAGTAATLRSQEVIEGAAGKVNVALVTGEGRDPEEPVFRSQRDFEALVPRDPEKLVRYEDTFAVDIRVIPKTYLGKDPDEIIHSDPQTWPRLVEEATPVLDYKLKELQEKLSGADPRGRSQMVQEFLPLLAAVTDRVVRAHYLQRLSRLALVSERELAGMLASVRTRRQASPVQATAATPAAPAKGQAREEFLLALLLQYPHLRPEGAELPEELLWASENRQVLAAWKQLEGIEAVKEALPGELTPHLERLLNRRLPSFSPKEAMEALADCRRRLERRQLEVEKQALAALLAAREEELGPSALAEAEAFATTADERTREVVSLHIRDMEMGRKLHRRGNDSDGGEAIGTSSDG